MRDHSNARMPASRAIQRILRIGAIRGEDQRSFFADASDHDQVPRKLDAFCEGTALSRRWAILPSSASCRTIANRAMTRARASLCPLREIGGAQVRVAAITTRKNDDGSPEFNDLIHCEQWEVVVPSLIYD